MADGLPSAVARATIKEEKRKENEGKWESRRGNVGKGYSFKGLRIARLQRAEVHKHERKQ